MKLSDKQRELFDLYYEILTDWNSKMNLTAITDKDEVWLKHFEDSLSLEQMIDLNKVDTVIDVINTLPSLFTKYKSTWSSGCRSSPWPC